ncbi:MAG: hypothetical protein NVV60_11110 [Luteimonas sp.]|nr:hypothetical protein [Luteimonas sp.]
MPSLQALLNQPVPRAGTATPCTRAPSANPHSPTPPGTGTTKVMGGDIDHRPCAESGHNARTTSPNQ